METITIIFNEEKSMDNFLCGNNWKESQKILCLQNPVNREIIEKYFLDDEEIETITEAMVEKPKIFEFDQNFKSNNLNHFYSDYLNEKIEQSIKQNFSQLFTLYSQQFLENFIFSNEEKSGQSGFINLVANKILENHKIINFKAILLTQDLTTQLIPDTNKTIVSKKQLETTLQNFITKFLNIEFNNDIEVKNSIIFLQFDLNNGTNLIFIILPKIYERSYEQSVTSKALNSINFFLENNVVIGEELIQKNNINSQTETYTQLTDLLRESVNGNFDFTFVCLLNGYESNYKPHENLLSNISFLKKKFELEDSDLSIKNSKPKKTEKLKNYINKLDDKINTNKLQSSEISFDDKIQSQTKKQEFRSVRQVSPENLGNLHQTYTKGFQATQVMGLNQKNGIYKLIREKVERNEDVFELRFKELEKENSFLKNSFAKQSQNFKVLVNKIKEKQKDNQNLRHQLEEYKLRCQGYDKDNMSVQKLNENLKLHNQELKEKQIKLESKIKGLMEKLKDFEILNSDKKNDFWQQRIEMNEKMNSLRDQITTKEQIIAQKNYELESALDQLNRKNSQIQSMEKQECFTQFQMEKTTQELEAVKKSFQEQKDSYQQEKKQLLDKMQQIETKFLQKNNKKKNLKKALKEQQDQSSKIREGTDVLIMKLRSEIESYKQQIVEKDKELIQKVNQCSSQEIDRKQNKIYKKEIEKLKQEKLNQHDEIMKLQFSEEKLKTIIQNQQQEKEQLNKENLLSLSQLEQVVRERDDVIDLLNETSKQKKQYEKQSQNLKEQNDVFIIQINQTKEEYDKVVFSFENKLEQITERIRQLQDENSKKSDEISQLEKELTNLNIKFEKQKQKNSILRQENEQGKLILEKYKVELKDKMFTVQKLQSDNDSKLTNQTKKVSMVSDIKNMITCFKNLNKQFLLLNFQHFSKIDQTKIKLNNNGNHE